MRRKYGRQLFAAALDHTARCAWVKQAERRLILQMMQRLNLAVEAVVIQKWAALLGLEGELASFLRASNPSRRRDEGC